MGTTSRFIGSTPEVGREMGAIRSVVVVLAAVFLTGCTAAISSIALDPAQPRVCDTSVTPNVCGPPYDQPVRFQVQGKGVCSPVIVQCGNGLSGTSSGQSHDFGQPPTGTPFTFECSYDTSWPGPKTVTAYSNGSSCVGQATQRINVINVRGGFNHRDYSLALTQPVTQACNQVPGISTPLRANTTVGIRTNPNPNVKIDFGCLLNGCIYDADGEPNSSAPASFPFAGLRKYSLVLRVGQQVVQGGTNMSFVTNQGGHLEFCVNDERLNDNSGAWGIFISVDESQAH